MERWACNAGFRIVIQVYQNCNCQNTRMQICRSDNISVAPCMICKNLDSMLTTLLYDTLRTYLCSICTSFLLLVWESNLRARNTASGSSQFKSQKEKSRLVQPGSSWNSLPRAIVWVLQEVVERNLYTLRNRWFFATIEKWTNKDKYSVASQSSLKENRCSHNVRASSSGVGIAPDTTFLAVFEQMINTQSQLPFT